VTSLYYMSHKKRNRRNES